VSWSCSARWLSGRGHTVGRSCPQDRASRTPKPTPVSTSGRPTIVSCTRWPVDRRSIRWRWSRHPARARAGRALRRRPRIRGTRLLAPVGLQTRIGARSLVLVEAAWAAVLQARPAITPTGASSGSRPASTRNARLQRRVARGECSALTGRARVANEVFAGCAWNGGVNTIATYPCSAVGSARSAPPRHALHRVFTGVGLICTPR
jgi:hypothetical protein